MPSAGRPTARRSDNPVRRHRSLHRRPPPPHPDGVGPVFGNGQGAPCAPLAGLGVVGGDGGAAAVVRVVGATSVCPAIWIRPTRTTSGSTWESSHTHLRAHETVL